MIIRELQKKDIPEVENIYDLYWSGNFRENLSKKLKEYIENSPETIEQGFKYFVVEENGEIVGVAAFRKVMGHMVGYTTTNNPVEFYISAVKYKRKGIGTVLREKRREEAKKLGYTEAVFFSANTHKDSWVFHDASDFKCVDDAIAPNGEEGKIWRMIF
jgi:L-amino acid N-acyltransferase YncA